MDGSWLHPAYAWGLLALAIPLVIHLWNRKQGRVVPVGSVRLLLSAESARANRLRLHEILLWLIRTALVVALVGWLMQWQRESEPTDTAAATTWTLLDPALPTASLPALESEANVRWLAPEFPTYGEENETPPADSATGWAHLLPLVQHPQRPDTVRLYTHPSTLRWPQPAPALPFVLQWQPLPLPQAATTALQHWQLSEGPQVWQATQEDSYTAVQRIAGKDTQGPNTTPSLRVYLGLSEDENEALASALELLAEYLRVPVRVVNQAEQATVAWIAPGDTVQFGDSVRVAVRETGSHAGPLWYSQLAPNRFVWHHRVDASAVSEALWLGLPEALIVWLLPQPEVPYVAQPQTQAAEAWPQAAKVQQDTPWLGWVVIVLLIAERSVATWRKA